MSEHNPTCADDANDCRCLTDPRKWPDISTPVRLTEDERQYAYPMEQGDFYLEDDVERIVAARVSAAATRARAEGAERVRLLLAKYEGRSKWVGYEPRREAWSEIENDLRALLRDRDARIARGDA